MTVKLDTTLQKYEDDGGDAKFIKDVTECLMIDPSLMKITNKRQGSVILTFRVKGGQDKPQEELKSKLKNVLLNELAYPVLEINDPQANELDYGKDEERDKVHKTSPSPELVAPESSMNLQGGVQSALTGRNSDGSKRNKGMSVVRTNITPLLNFVVEDGIEGIAVGLD